MSHVVPPSKPLEDCLRPFPSSEKTYVESSSGIRVPFRKITLTPTRSHSGELITNERSLYGSLSTHQCQKGTPSTSILMDS